MRFRKALAIFGAFVATTAGGVLVATPAHASVPGNYHLVNILTLKCADVANESTAVSAIVHQWSCGGDGNRNQWWFPTQLGNGYMQLKNLNSQLCLHVRGTLPITGLIVDQDGCDVVAPNNEWRLLPADDFGRTVLQSGLGNVCLALKIYSSRNGVDNVVNSCATTSAQLYTLS